MSMILRPRSHNHRCKSTADIHSKLARIVSSHEQLKLSFHHLKSQIKTGLHEAEDVFNSLAVPLMKLVGLKTAEMAEEGRSSTIFMNTAFQSYSRNDLSPETPRSSSPTVNGEYGSQKLEEDYATKVTKVGKEVIQKQKLQLTQLLHLLKQIESQVNYSQDTIFKSIDDHRSSIHKFFQKAFTYVSAVHQSSQTNNTLPMTLKLLKATHDQFQAVLSSVERGVENLMSELSEHMCSPMIEYVRGFKTEISNGTCPRLLCALEEMGEAARDGMLELEHARKKARIAEERKLEALSMLKESEERLRKMKEHLGFLEYKETSGHHDKNKMLGSVEGHSKDEKLLWELLKKKKRKCQQPGSPFGPPELPCIGTHTNGLKSTSENSSIGCRPATRGYLKNLASRSPCLNSWTPLGSSPSAMTNEVLSRKRVRP